MKTKLKITEKKTETINREVNVKLPFYSTDGIDWFKVISAKEAIEVSVMELINCYIIKTCKADKAFGNRMKDCTEEDFTAAYDKALSRIIGVMDKGSTNLKSA